MYEGETVRERDMDRGGEGGPHLGLGFGAVTSRSRSYRACGSFLPALCLDSRWGGRSRSNEQRRGAAGAVVEEAGS
jgi:hypothetical protein